MRVEISGGIASGKTTLATVLAEHVFSTNLEDFQSNPFWTAFYQDPKGTAFETELTFFLQHYHGMKLRRSIRGPVVCDHSLLLDLAYSRVTLNGRRLRIFEQVFGEIWDELGPPELLVQLRCDPETELQRVKRRARETEKSIDLRYLAALNTSLDSVILENRQKLRILEIDSAVVNFAELENTKVAVRQEVMAAMSTSNSSA